MRRFPVLFLALFVSCAGWDPADVESTDRDAAHDSVGEIDATIKRFKARDPSMQRFFDSAHAYAVWPGVGKGGLVIGGAYGRGAVYEQGKLIGFSSLTQVSVGAQIGGQSYAEIIFFKDKAALENFKRGNFELGAQVSAVAVEEGASANSSYDSGVAVFTLPKAGLMAEATVAGQQFTFDAR